MMGQRWPHGTKGPWPWRQDSKSLVLGSLTLFWRVPHKVRVFGCDTVPAFEDLTVQTGAVRMTSRGSVWPHSCDVGSAFTWGQILILPSV